MIFSRKRDVDIARRAAEGAAKLYGKLSGRNIQFNIEGTLSDGWCVIDIPSFFLTTNFVQCQRRRGQAL